MNPSALTRFAAGSGITITSNAVLPYLAANAKSDLQKVGSVQINSAFRTVAQQYLLLQWFDRGRCGTTAAATPVNTELALTDGTTQLGSVLLAVTVTPDGDDNLSGDADDQGDTEGNVAGGCAAGGSGAAGWLMLAPLALVLRRRRR